MAKALATVVAVLVLGACVVSAQLNSPLMDWMYMLEGHIRTAKPMNHQVASRTYAEMARAMHQSVLWKRKYNLTAVSDEVMICYTAHAYLTYKFEASSTEHDRLISRHLATAPKAVREQARGVARSAAYKVIKDCVTDGFATWSEFELPNTKATGLYQLQPGQVCQHPQWGWTKPFTLKNRDVNKLTSKYLKRVEKWFGSDQYYTDIQFVQEWGGVASQKRDATDDETPFFWADPAGTSAAAGHWINMTAQILPSSMNIYQQTKFFAAFLTAMSDASIPCFKIKYKKLLWRPLTAITTGDATGRINVDPTWEPFMNVPNHPSYPSGHSCIAGAAERFLQIYFGTDDTEITTVTENPNLPSSVRAFTKFSAIADEAGLSRVLGGLHYPTDCTDGRKLGNEVAEIVAKAFGYKRTTKVTTTTMITNKPASVSSDSAESLSATSSETMSSSEPLDLQQVLIAV